MLPNDGSGRTVPPVPGNGALMFLLLSKCTPRAVSHENVVLIPCGHAFSSDSDVFTLYGAMRSSALTRNDVGGSTAPYGGLLGSKIGFGTTISSWRVPSSRIS